MKVQDAGYYAWYMKEIGGARERRDLNYCLDLRRGDCALHEVGKKIILSAMLEEWRWHWRNYLRHDPSPTTP